MNLNMGTEFASSLKVKPDLGKFNFGNPKFQLNLDAISDSKNLVNLYLMRNKINRINYQYKNCIYERINFLLTL